jgi:hypothetical protein
MQSVSLSNKHSVLENSLVEVPSVSWVEKLARRDWSAFQGGDLGCIIAVGRKRLWEELTRECADAVACYEQEYLRRIAWTASSVVDEESPDRILHRATIVEKGSPDRILFELRFDTTLPAIYFCTFEPLEASGVVTLVLDEANEVRFSYRGMLTTPSDLAKILLAPVLFRVNVHHPELHEDLVELARIRGAYGEGALLGRNISARPRFPIADISYDKATHKNQNTKTHKNQNANWVAAVRHPNTPWLRYGLASSTILLATLLIFACQSFTAVPIYWLLSGAIIFTFIQWGVGPGLAALLIGTAATDYFFIEPIYELSFNATVRLLGLAYALMAFSAYWIAERRRSHLTV